MKRCQWLLIFLLTAILYNYPNPFNPQGGQTTTIECRPDTTVEATLYIYDLAARLVVQKAFTLAGGATNQTTWNGYSDYNQLVGNGVYPYQVIDSTNTRVGKGKVWVINQ